MSETLASPRRLPLTDLSEDEGMFRDQVRSSPRRKVRPSSRRWTRKRRCPAS